MGFLEFVGESGLKVLAFSRLTPCEYSIMLYLLNCSASGLNEFITTERELSSLIGYGEKELVEGLANLEKANLVRVGTLDHSSHDPDRQSIRIGIQFDMSKWHIGYDKEVTSHDAVVFPFRRGGSLHLIEGETDSANHRRKPVQPKLKNEATWKRVVESYLEDRQEEEINFEKLERDAKILVETHPVDQVLLMLRHFSHRIPTLSLLASSWQHYQEIFEEETHRIDLQDARQKHHEQDHRLKDVALNLLDKKEQLELTEEEVTVLDILVRHRHPRRQLFWAYQSRSRYPNLSHFFEENAKFMLPVTTMGMVIKKKTDY
ncbi:MAG: hypothetical protein AB7T49_05915 [Oligoflexales bacterium]